MHRYRELCFVNPEARFYRSVLARYIHSRGSKVSEMEFVITLATILLNHAQLLVRTCKNGDQLLYKAFGQPPPGLYADQTKAGGHGPALRMRFAVVLLRPPPAHSGAEA